MLFELAAGLDSELAKHLAEVIADGVWADEQLGGDLLVGGTVGREAGNLDFLGCQVVTSLHGPFAGALTGRRELDPGARGERVQAELREQLVSGA